MANLPHSYQIFRLFCKLLFCHYLKKKREMMKYWFSKVCLNLAFILFYFKERGKGKKKKLGGEG